MNVKDIQQALKDRGYDPGPVDGIRGRKTIKAIKAFQAENGLLADGLVGSETTAKLFPQNSPAASQTFAIPVSMPWLDAAYQLIGTQEKPGLGSNEAILGWAEDLGPVDTNSMPLLEVIFTVN